MSANLAQRVMELLVGCGKAVRSDFRGCSEAEVRKLEQHLGLTLPTVYRDFLLAMGMSAGPLFRGTDAFYRHLFELRGFATELLSEQGIPFRLPESAVVIAMHQGYEFCFVDTEPALDDPPVYQYVEGDVQPTRGWESYSEYLLESADALA